MNEEIKKYTESFIEFMKDDEAKDNEEFRMPPLPLLTLNGIKEKPGEEISVSELKQLSKEVRNP